MKHSKCYELGYFFDHTVKDFIVSVALGVFDFGDNLVDIFVGGLLELKVLLNIVDDFFEDVKGDAFSVRKLICQLIHFHNQKITVIVGY